MKTIILVKQMEIRACSKCNIEYELSLENFGTYTYKGNTKWLRRCRTCMADYKNSHYENNKESYLERSKRQKEDNPEEYQQYCKDYYQRNREEMLAKSKIYNLSKEGRENNRICSRRYRENKINRLKDAVRSLVSHAVKTGKLIRPDNCSSCNVKCKPEGHHKDYNKPLEVIWLCKNCHEKLHHLNEGNISNE